MAQVPGSKGPNRRGVRKCCILASGMRGTKHFARHKFGWSNATKVPFAKAQFLFFRHRCLFLSRNYNLRVSEAHFCRKCKQKSAVRAQYVNPGVAETPSNRPLDLPRLGKDFRLSLFMNVSPWGGGIAGAPLIGPMLGNLFSKADFMAWNSTNIKCKNHSAILLKIKFRPTFYPALLFIKPGMSSYHGNYRGHHHYHNCHMAPKKGS